MQFSSSSRWMGGLILATLLTACGGGGGGGTDSDGAPTAPEAPVLTTSRLQLAQTHVIPAEGSHWSLEDADYRLTLVGQRAALLMVDLGSTAPEAPWVEGWVGETLLGKLPLNPPSQLPKSAGQAATYDTQLHSATLPAPWVQPGLRLRFGASQRSVSAWSAVTVGMDSRLALQTLPFYLFGATEANTFPLSSTGAPSPAVRDEIFSVWPIASLQAGNHAARQVAWPALVVGPRNGQPAKVLRNSSEQRDGYDIMSTVLGLIGGLRGANGEGGTNTLYYAPLLMLDAAGRYANPYGGLGTVGGGTGTGDHTYSGIFIHEAGHSLGLGHANDDFNAKRFPYANGSLNGSAWGYDAVRQQLVAPWLDASSGNFASCGSSTTRQKDALGHCFKQDNMQGGAGDQPAGYRYQMHADANAGRIQTLFVQGKTSVAANGTHQYSQGAVHVDTASPTGYSRWDSVDARRVPVSTETTDGGLWGLDKGLPVARQVPVHALALTYSRAGTPGVSQIYAPLSFTGNLRRLIDPTVEAERASVVINTSANYWYCVGTGCDFTLRLTYADQSVRHVLLQGGFRTWFKPTIEPDARTLEASSGNSFKTWVVNVPGDKALQRVELLDTPMAWQGLPAQPRVLLSRSL